MAAGKKNGSEIEQRF